MNEERNEEISLYLFKSMQIHKNMLFINLRKFNAFKNLCQLKALSRKFSIKMSSKLKYIQVNIEY